MAASILARPSNLLLPPVLQPLPLPVHIYKTTGCFLEKKKKKNRSRPLVPRSVVGRGCRIGPHAVIEDSFLLDNVTIGE